MIVDADIDRSAAAGLFDVCVIGSGPAGITLARRLAAGGARVALMEGGGYDVSEPSQEIYRGENVGLEYFDLDSARIRCFGGSSNHWGGWCLPLSPIDFAPKPGQPRSGWPITAADLEPYAAETDSILDLPVPPALPAPIGPSDPRFTETAFRFSDPPTRFREKFEAEIAASTQLTLFLNANLVDLALSRDHDRVTSGVFRGFVADDPGFSISARTFALCCGGIENARLLLNFNRQVPEGIGNANGLVGRYFSEHPHFATADVLLAEPLPAQRFFAVTEAFMADAGVQNSLVNLDPASPRPVPTLTTAAKRSIRCEVPFLNQLAHEVMGGSPDCGAPALRDWWSGESLPRATLRFNQEQEISPDSRVFLGESQDAFGLYTTALDWRLTDLDVKTMRTVTIAFGEYLASTGIGRVRLRDWLMQDPPAFPGVADDEVAGYHHMGTTRMAASPEDGVVDADCRVFGIDNLYIGGSSVFSTGGYANPTYTIVQMALRLGDHLTERLATAEDSVQPNPEMIGEPQTAP